MIPTESSLMFRLANNPDDVTWQDFFMTYKITILAYAQRQGLDPADADDVLQETMVAIIKAFRNGFRYDRSKGRFRGFLRLIVRRRIADAIRRRVARPLVYTDQMDSFVDVVEIQDDMDWKVALILQALERFRDRDTFSQQSLAVFEAYAIKGLSAQDVSARCGVTANNVYQIHKRILEALKVELAYLEGTDVV